MSFKVAAKAIVKGGVVAAASHLPRRTVGMRCLLYHSVVPTPRRDPKQMTVSVDLLTRQIEYLCAHGYTVADAPSAVAELRTGAAPAKTVVITFDDGYGDNLELALPILERFRCTATIFMSREALAGEERPVYADRFLSVAEARDMISSGLVTIGCHGDTHRALSDLSDAEVRRETADAKAWMEDALGVAVPLFAYPYGSFDSFDRRVRDAVQRAGFDAAFTSIVGPNTARTDPFRLLRSRISWAEEILSFGRLLNGGYDWYAGLQWVQSRRPHPRDGHR
jgi:peptidoglycan/xylan/chitin deacetylase (PgdA/CDA1 family)